MTDFTGKRLDDDERISANKKSSAFASFIFAALEAGETMSLENSGLFHTAQ